MTMPKKTEQQREDEALARLLQRAGVEERLANRLAVAVLLAVASDSYAATQARLRALKDRLEVVDLADIAARIDTLTARVATLETRTQQLKLAVAAPAGEA